MKITSNTETALQALSYLANSTKPVTLGHIATTAGLSVHYLEQIFRKLRVAGIVKSVRGPGGGYVLNPYKDVTVWDVQSVLETNKVYKNKLINDAFLAATDYLKKCKINQLAV